MKASEAANLLQRIGVLRSRCDLDLLIFFARHPTALLTSEQLAHWLGHELKAIAVSLDVLLDAGLIERNQNPAHAARMYVFRDSVGGGWLPSLLRLAKTRAGRLALIEALGPAALRGGDASASRSRDANAGQRAPALSIVRAPGDADAPEPSPPERKTRHGRA